LFTQKTGGKKAQKKINSSGCHHSQPLNRFPPAAFKQIFFGQKRSIISVDDDSRTEKLGEPLFILCLIAP